MDQDRMYELVNKLAVAKSNQDLEAALKLQHQDMILECPPFGTKAKGLEQNRIALQIFFATFPDYNISLEGYAGNGTDLVCWGIADMKPKNGWMGFQINGDDIRLPVFLRFTFRESLIASEYFFFDLSELCQQSAIPADKVRNKLFDEYIFREILV